MQIVIVYRIASHRIVLYSTRTSTAPYSNSIYYTYHSAPMPARESRAPPPPHPPPAPACTKLGSHPTPPQPSLPSPPSLLQQQQHKLPQSQIITTQSINPNQSTHLKEIRPSPPPPPPPPITTNTLHITPPHTTHPMATTTTTAAAAATTTTTRALYRTLLRELPPISQKRTHLHTRLRSSISSSSSSSGEGETRNKDRQLLGQLATYLRAQRTYATLLERYNPSLGPRGDDDRIRMSARRVGLDMPE